MIGILNQWLATLGNPPYSRRQMFSSIVSLTKNCLIAMYQGTYRAHVQTNERSRLPLIHRTTVTPPQKCCRLESLWVEYL
jgi:hypothetical protein